MIRVGVVGAGVMGGNHVRVLSGLSNCEIVAVIDADESRGRMLAGSIGAEFFPAGTSLAGMVDAAIVATPSELHEATSIPLLRAGIDVLVEKPLADDLGAARRILATAREAHAILMVGHVERFNPAVIEVKKFIDDPVHFRFSRVGPFTSRISSDVVLDLMVHDLDIALHLTGSAVNRVSAVGHRVRTDTYDMACALVSFESGVTASLTASRIGQNKIREIAVTQVSNAINVDLLRQDLTIHRIHHSEYATAGRALYRQSGLIEIPMIDTRGEPLALELRHFLNCIEERSSPDVSGDDAIRALEAVVAVQESLNGTHTNIHPI